MTNISDTPQSSSSPANPGLANPRQDAAAGDQVVFDAMRSMKPEELEANAEQVAGVLDIISNTKRLLILCKLLDGELNVTSLAEAVGLGQSALSQHLAKLREGRIVTTRRDGQHIYYSLHDPRVRVLLQTLYGLYCGQNVKGS